MGLLPRKKPETRPSAEAPDDVSFTTEVWATKRSAQLELWLDEPVAEPPCEFSLYLGFLNLAKLLTRNDRTLHSQIRNGKFRVRVRVDLEPIE